MLLGIDKPSSGKIKYFNYDIFSIKNSQLKYYQNNEIGILFQHFNLFDELSCIDNVILPALIAGKNQNDVYNDATSLFEKYQISHLTKQKYSTLSGGEKQRVALLRALINNPKVIFADEPTGALDSKNSELVMSELKALSKTKLIVVVSHNEELLTKYEDIRLEINNKKIKSNYSCTFDASKTKLTNKKSNKLSVFNFVKMHLKQHRTRNLIVGLSVAVSSICILLSLGYILGSKSSLSNYQRKSLEYNVANIAKKNVVDIPGSPIKIYKMTRPTIDEVNFVKDHIGSAHFENNYQSIFPYMPNFIIDNKEISDVAFAPVYKYNNNIAIAGCYPDDNDFFSVVVNQEFARSINYLPANLINHTFKLSFSAIVNVTISGSKVIKDELIFNQSLTIKAVVEEFAYLNSPRIYYSYQGLDKLLENKIAINYSQYRGLDTSFKEIVANAKGDDAISGYSLLLFVDDINEIDNLFFLKDELDKNNQYDVISNSYTIIKSYQSMNDVIATSLVVFIIIAAVGAVSIIVITSFAAFVQEKKEYAILSTLGMKQNDIFLIFILESLLVNTISFIASLFFIVPLQYLINRIFANCFRLENLVQTPFLSLWPIAMFLIVVFCSYISSYIPFRFYERGYVALEIKDE